MLSQVAPVVRSPLNNRSISDYFFGGYDGSTFQFGRVQAGELLGNIDSMEDELRRYYNSATNNFQIVEGIISPDSVAVPTDKQLFAIRSGKLKWFGKVGITTRDTDSFSPTQPPPSSMNQTYGYKVECVTDIANVSRYAVTRGHTFHTPITLYYAWKHRLAMAGVITYETLNWIETARLLATIYKNEQKPPEEHTTLQRIVRPRLQLKEQEPFVRALVYLSAAMKIDVGEKTATLIAEKFANIGDLYLASVEDLTEIKGIGRITAEKILRALGRSIE
jgi:hypothetical protein